MNHIKLSAYQLEQGVDYLWLVDDMDFYKFPFGFGRNEPTWSPTVFIVWASTLFAIPQKNSW